jgi:hypothetical protein
VRTSNSSPSAPPEQVVDAEGFALTPSTIYTASGSVKLLTFAALEFKPERFTPDEVRGNLEAHLAGARISGTGPLDADYRALQAVLKDTDGAIRYDRGPGRLDPGHAHLITEHVVQDDDYVCVFGKYSAEKRGIVSDPDAPMLIPTRLRKGSIQSLSRGLTRGAIGYVLGAVAWAAVAVGAGWAFLRFGPPF